MLTTCLKEEKLFSRPSQSNLLFTHQLAESEQISGKGQQPKGWTTRALTSSHFPVLRHDRAMQMSSLKKKYLNYGSYEHQRIEDVFTGHSCRGEIRNLLLLTSREGKFALVTIITICER